MISVVIPVLNGATTITAQLDALLAQVDDIAEVIVVDNGSSDDTASLASSYTHNGLPVRVISEPVRGVNRARNAGIRAASYEKVLLCDADDVVAIDWARSLSTLLDTFDLAGTAVTRVLTRQDCLTVVVDLASHGPIAAGLYSPWGCSAGFRKQAWTSVGGFDNRMSGGADDVDFFLRAQLAGLCVGWVNESKITYLDNSDPEKQLRRQREMDINMGRVSAIAWLRGHKARPSVAPSVLKLLALAPLRLLAPTATNRSRFRRHFLRCRDRFVSWHHFGLPELQQAGIGPVLLRLLRWPWLG